MNLSSLIVNNSHIMKVYTIKYIWKILVPTIMTEVNINSFDFEILQVSNKFTVGLSFIP